MGVVEEGNVKVTEKNERSFEGGRRHVGVELDEADEKVGTRGARTVVDDIVEQKLREG